MNKPMMSDREIEIIDGLIEKLRPAECLEWGSGGSTIYFPQHNCIKSWLSIEHNGHFKKDLDKKIKNNVNIFWTTNKWLYINHPKEKKFDFILIDGVHRMECLEMAIGLLNKNGFILLHDSGRTEYDLSQYNYQILLDGEIPTKDGFAHRGLALIQ